MTNTQVIGYFAVAFAATNPLAVVQEILISGRANDTQWRDQIPRANTKYKGILANAAGRSLDDFSDQLATDLQNGQLPHHIFLEIAKMKGEYKEFVKAQFIRKMNNPQFKAQFCAKSAIRVGKLNRLLIVYPAVKDGIRLLSKLGKKNQTWILITALNYNRSIKLQQIDPEKETAAIEAEAEGADVAPSTLTPTPLGDLKSYLYPLST